MIAKFYSSGDNVGNNKAQNLMLKPDCFNTLVVETYENLDVGENFIMWREIKL